MLQLRKFILSPRHSGPGSVVGIATGHRLDGTGIESRWGGTRFSAPVPDQPWGPPSFLYIGYRVFPPGVNSGRGVTLIPHFLLVPLVMKV